MTIAIHGFLGSPEDWSTFPELTPYNLWEGPIIPFEQWAERFNAGHTGTLLGYSLGARLALHALIAKPDNWKSAVIVSAHPGLADGRRRAEADAVWAAKFENEPWDALMREWNEQPVFIHDSLIKRNESYFDRAKLAKALRTWSLGLQRELADEIAALPMPILWVVGGLDGTFVAAAKNLKFSNSKSQVAVVPNAGHRVPWHQPERFKTLLKEWTHDCYAHANLDAY